MTPQKPVGNTVGNNEAPLDRMAGMDHGSQSMGDVEGHSGWRHWGMMILCCLPMIAFVVLLILGIWR